MGGTLTELAPEGCIVCDKKRSEQPDGWVYLAGSIPLGAMACSAACADVAVKRFAATGRVDTGERT
jgi:hypothetical protein